MARLQDGRITIALYFGGSNSIIWRPLERKETPGVEEEEKPPGVPNRTLGVSAAEAGALQEQASSLPTSFDSKSDATVS
jgi:hypothetical protein